MGELIALRWDDVDFDTEALHVYGSTASAPFTAPKSGPTRTVPTAEQVRDLLKEHRDRVPPRPRRPRLPRRARRVPRQLRLRHRYKKALDKAELRPLRFHDLRHTFGSIAINQATIVQSRRGWATPTCRPR
jgi:integrase